MATLLHRSSQTMADAAWDGRSLLLSDVGGALAVCSRSGDLLGATPTAAALLDSLGLDVSSLPRALPATLWQSIVSTPRGSATEWSPEGASESGCLGCTAYDVGADHVLLLMREVSKKQRVLAQKVHRQRLESMGRLVTAVTHDLRASLLPIVFHANAMLERLSELPEEEIRTSLGDIAAAGATMRKTLDTLLDYARSGKPVVGPVMLSDVAARAAAIVRGLLREGRHSLAIAIDPGAECVCAHPLALEHVLVNLLVNAMESALSGVHIHIVGSRARGAKHVHLRVEDDGAGVPAHLRPRLFEPFFTTKERGTGLGLSSSREAIRDLGGDLTFEPLEHGSAFVVTLDAMESA